MVFSFITLNLTFGRRFVSIEGILVSNIGRSSSITSDLYAFINPRPSSVNLNLILPHPTGNHSIIFSKFSCMISLCLSKKFRSSLLINSELSVPGDINSSIKMFKVSSSACVRFISVLIFINVFFFTLHLLHFLSNTVYFFCCTEWSRSQEWGKSEHTTVHSVQVAGNARRAQA